MIKAGIPKKIMQKAAPIKKLPLHVRLTAPLMQLRSKTAPNTKNPKAQ
jgi:hypothetical protein